MPFFVIIAIMLKLILLFSMFSIPTLAKDCATEAGNLSLASKLKGRLSHFAELNHPDPCKLDEPDWEESRNHRIKLVRLINDQLRSKKKTSASFFLDIDDTSGKEDLTENEICDITKKKQGQLFGGDRCETDGLKQKLGSLNLMQMNFQQACESVWVDIKKSKTKCFEDAQKVSQRDPPGEEIAPAEENTPSKEQEYTKTPSHFYGARTIIKPRKSRSPKPTSGASGQ